MSTSYTTNLVLLFLMPALYFSVAALIGIPLTSSLFVNNILLNFVVVGFAKSNLLAEGSVVTHKKYTSKWTMYKSLILDISTTASLLALLLLPNLFPALLSKVISSWLLNTLVSFPFNFVFVSLVSLVDVTIKLIPAYEKPWRYKSKRSSLIVEPAKNVTSKADCKPLTATNIKANNEYYGYQYSPSNTENHNDLTSISSLSDPDASDQYSQEIVIENEPKPSGYLTQLEREQEATDKRPYFDNKDKSDYNLDKVTKPREEDKDDLDDSLATKSACTEDVEAVDTFPAHVEDDKSVSTFSACTEDVDSITKDIPYKVQHSKSATENYNQNRVDDGILALSNNVTTRNNTNNKTKTQTIDTHLDSPNKENYSIVIGSNSYFS